MCVCYQGRDFYDFLWVGTTWGWINNNWQFLFWPNIVNCFDYVDPWAPIMIYFKHHRKLFPSLYLHMLLPVQSLFPSEHVLTPPLLCGLVPPSGKRRDEQEAMEYILEMYQRQAVNVENKDCKNIYYHFTCATDTSNIRKVFNDVKDTVLIASLKAFGVL